MATMSIGKAWEEAVAFISREATLLFPVALLFVALPGVILQEMAPSELASWTMNPNNPVLPHVPPSFWAGLLLTVVLIWFGSLTLFALAMRPGISVGEALRLSLARLPVLIGTGLVLAVAFVFLVITVIAVVVVLTLLSKPLGAVLGGVLAIGIGGFAMVVSIRLLLLNPVVIDGRLGVVESIRHSWQLTRGHFWRLLAFILILTGLSAIVASAAQAVFGLVAGLVGGKEVAQFAGGLAAAAVSTVVQVYMLVMLARLYRQAEGA